MMVPIIKRAELPPKGRTSGSKNKETSRRDAAIAKGREYRSGGMKLFEASAKIIDEYNLYLTPRYVSQLIAGSK
jgi:hypothetical protein